MKLTAILLFVAVVSASAKGYSQGITLSLKSASIEEVFKAIEKQTGYSFIYGKKQLKQSKLVDLDVKNEKLENILEIIFKGQPLSYTISGKYIAVKLKQENPNAESHTEPLAQVSRPVPINIKGRVTNENGEPVAGATVKVKGTSNATATNSNGEFVLKGVDENATLLITGVNIEAREMKVDGKTDLAITAIIKVTAQEEVIVNAGYYNVKKREATGSISRVDAKTIEKQPVTNPLGALHGRMPGVQIQQTSGVPGNAFKIEIRGRNSLRDEGNEPLYIIDGVPFSSQTLSHYYTVGEAIQGGVSPLTSINPADIESIEILKDADATAIYGSRGANGVVLITTRKGKAGKTKFEINYYSGFSKVPLVKQLNTEQYLAMRREAFALEGLTPSANINDDGTINSNYRAYAPDLMVWDTTRYTDWQKFFVGNTAYTTSLQTSLSGGNESMQFLARVSYFKETSVNPGKFSYRKLSSHLSVNHTSLNKKFFFSAIVNGSRDMHDQPQTEFSRESRWKAPNAPKLYNDDGSLNWENSTWRNPMAQMERTFEGTVNYLLSSATAGYEILPRLKLQAKAGITRNESDEISTLPSTEYDPASGRTSEYSVVNTTAGRNQSWIIEPQINWETRIAKGQLTTLAGVTYQREHYQQIVLSYRNFPSNTLLGDLSTAVERSVNNYDKTIYKYAAVFGRINYNWDKKYILNLTGRRDGSSRFGPGKQFANFGAAGVAWIFSKEPLVEKKLPWLSFGKLRVSYGITGSDQFGNYQYLDTYAAAQGNINSYNGVTALEPSRLFNPVFGWESNKKLEAALELGFLNDRITLSTAWYRNRSSNQLVNYNLPSITGFSGILANFPATVQNKGIEIELNTANIRSSSFSWTTSLNVTIPRNKLLEFPNIDSSSYAQRYIVGESIYIQKFYEYTGINPLTGLYTVRDVNGDGKISRPPDNSKAMLVGQDFFGGINNSFTYRGWSLDVFLQFVKQTGKLMNYLPGIINSNIPAYFLDLKRWQKPGDNAEIQRFTTEYSMGGFISTIINSPIEWFNVSDVSVVDASFIRLKTVSIAYQLPSAKFKAISGSVYLRGQNLFVLTRYKGSDPETQSGFVLPPLRTITIGINLTL